ncbi:GNAT family N-acetyltransferase [Rubellimicrobium rubrum]|uniref:GNAT family N-acetyltransferase n=1 Tax=Rubellimicrobium rubrum TaxID=2585369 RepID=A0A5C4N5B6_9RHOB|nr:GNAT family N-acetyltransferase [Rubellimicrobium rubrum]TNC52818.1 GNAT family N-acetyltransferase [Rubellimicrobium rubrum]
MDDLPSGYRRATPDDAGPLTDLVDIAGEGLASYLWAKQAQDGEAPQDVGRRRAIRDEGSFSFRNAVVADDGQRIMAALIGYPLADAPEPIPDDFPPMFVPMQELENLAAGTWYVNALAAYPESRGHGHGTALLGVAERLARSAGKRGVSMIVSDANPGAWRLYERCGFKAVESRPMVKKGWDNPGSTWTLLMRVF